MGGCREGGRGGRGSRAVARWDCGGFVPNVVNPPAATPPTTTTHQLGAPLREGFVCVCVEITVASCVFFFFNKINTYFLKNFSAMTICRC